MDTPAASRSFGLRKMEEKDLPRVVSLENECHPGGCWKERDFRFVMSNRNATCLVAEHEGSVIGYIVYKREWNKLDIENVAVAPAHRRQGIATDMVERVIKDLPAQGRHRITLEVRKGNNAAQSCYRKLGFQVTSEIPGYYWQIGEDALVMEYRLPDRRCDSQKNFVGGTRMMKNDWPSYLLYAVLGTLSGYLLVPAFFSGGIASAVLFGIMLIALLVSGKVIERYTWRTIGVTAAQNTLTRFVIRICIYWLLPALTFLAASLLLPEIFSLPRGFIQAIALTYFPMFVGSMLDLWPVKQL